MAGEVVRAGDGLDLEPPVLAGARLAVLEDDHAADRLAALEVADVVALDPRRRTGQPERLGQLLERRERLALVGQPARLLARERLGRVAGGQRRAARASRRAGARGGGPARPAARRGTPRASGVSVDGRGHVDLARDRAGPAVVLLEEAGQDLVVGRLAGGVEQEHVAADHLAVADHEQLDGRLVVLAGEADQVELGPGEGGHLLALHRPLDGPDLVAQDGRPLVLGALGGDRHLHLERLDQRLLATLEEQLDLLDVGPVVVLRDRRDARTLAALDVIQEARPLEGAHAVLDVDRAGPEREQPADEVHRFVDARRRGVRPEVAAAVVDELARPLDPRELVAQGHLDVRIALVVLEPDVEPRPVALDEVGLEEERLGDRIRLGDLDVDDPVDDAPDPVDLAAGRLLLPVRAHAVAQALRLADIDDVAPGVLHEVDAGPVGQLGQRG